MKNTILQYRKSFYSLPKDFPFQLFHVKGKTEKIPSLHIHDCLEVNVVLNGGGEYIIEDEHYKIESGDFYIINDLERHFAYPDEATEMLVIIFDPNFIWSGDLFDYEYLRPFYNRDIQFSNCIRENEAHSTTLFEIVQEIKREWDQKDGGFRLVIKALLMKLLAVLHRHYSIENKSHSDLKMRRKSYDRIKEVIEYIYYHYNEELKLEALAKMALMNKTYFSAYFKKVMQMNVSDYIVTLRINYASTQLKNTNRSVNDISYESGFKSISHFNRIFKKTLGMTPVEFRKAENKL